MLRFLVITLVCFVFAGVSTKGYAQTDSVAAPRRGPYNLVVTAGGGLSYYALPLGLPPTLEQARIDRFSAPASLRIMWHPDHRLRIGLETGWITMYQYRGQIGGESARVRVVDVPALIVFSMPLAWLSGTERSLARRLALTAGTGAYFNRSQLSYLGSANATAVSLGWMLAGSYSYPIGRRWRLAAEAKWYDAVAVDNAVFVAELQVSWRAFAW